MDFFEEAGNKNEFLNLRDIIITQWNFEKDIEKIEKKSERIKVKILSMKMN